MGQKRSNFHVVPMMSLLLVLSVWIYCKVWWCEHFPRYPTHVEYNNRKHQATESTTNIKEFDGKNKEYCNNGLLRQYIETNDYFPGDGRWSGSQFQPSICKFMPVAIPQGYLRRCVSYSGLVSLATLGDSQGTKYFNAMLDHFQSDAATCRQIKSEGNGATPNKAYFAQGNKALRNAFQAEIRGCRSCISQGWLCQFKRNDTKLSVMLENISMAHVWDHSLMMKKGSSLQSKYSFASFQEFVFKYYFNVAKPDVIFIFAPLNHEKPKNKSDMTMAVTNLAHVLKANVPFAKTYIIGGTSEYENMKPQIWRNIEYHGMSSTAKIDFLNHVLYDAVRNLSFGFGRQIYSFLDMVKISANHESWSLDGVHFNSPWYKTIASYLLQLFCNDYIN